MLRLTVLAACAAGAAGLGRVAVLCQPGGIGEVCARVLAESGANPLVLVQEPAAVSVSGADVRVGDFRKGLGDFGASLDGVDSAVVAMDGAAADIAMEREAFAAALQALPDSGLPGTLCAVVPSKEDENAGGGNFFNPAPTCEAALKKAREAGAARRVRVVHHAELVGSAGSGDGELPFDGPPLVAPKVNPAAALGGVELSGSRAPQPNPFVSLEAQRVCTTRRAAAQAAASAAASGPLAEALADAGEYAEVTVLSILGPQAQDADWARVCERYRARGPELLTLALPALEETPARKWLTQQFPAQALKGVALFANQGARPVNARRTAGAGGDVEVEVLWETLTEDLRAEPAGSIVFSLKGAAGGGVEFSATRRGVRGDALAEPLQSEDDLLRSFIELLNKKFPAMNPPKPKPAPPAMPTPAAAAAAPEPEPKAPTLDAAPRRRRE